MVRYLLEIFVLEMTSLKETVLQSDEGTKMQYSSPLIWHSLTDGIKRLRCGPLYFKNHVE